MDIVSHGLWGGVAFGRSGRRAYWQAFGIGVSPDLLSFGLLAAADTIGMVSGPDWGAGRPDPALIPAFVHSAYDLTHSLVVFAAVYGLIWFVRRKHYLPLLAWPLHILVDMPTHSSEFFPTPFLWPVSDFTVPGISWGQPIIFFPNLALLAVAYAAWLVARRRNKAGPPAASL